MIGTDCYIGKTNLYLQHLMRERDRMKKKTLYKGKYIKLVKKGDWEYSERVNCSGVVVIFAKTDWNKIILIEQNRVPVGKSVIECPAGLVGDKGIELVSDAAYRELLEETGYKAKKITKLTTGPSSAGSSSGLIDFVLAENLVKVNEGGGTENEDIKVHEVSMVKIESWLKSMEKKGCLISPRVYMALYFLKKE